MAEKTAAVLARAVEGKKAAPQVKAGRNKKVAPKAVKSFVKTHP
jgi:hypothetical protein